MSIFTDTIASVGKSTLNRVVAGAVAAIVLVFIASKVLGWIGDAFSKEPTREELVVQNSQQQSVIATQDQALKDKDETLATAQQLTSQALGALTDWNQDSVMAVTNTAKITTRLDKADIVNQAEIIKINALEKDEKLKAQRLQEADQRLMEAQNAEIEQAYQLALKRAPSAPL